MRSLDIPYLVLEDLLEVLNDPKHRARKRLIAFIRALQEIKQARPGNPFEEEDIELRIEEEILPKLHGDRSLAPHYTHYGGSLRSWLKRDLLSSLDQHYREAARLERAGAFEILAECKNCGRWHIRSRRWQQSCSMRCRQKTYRSKPEVKKKRARYMRDYYDQNLRSDRKKQKREKKP
jgi:hypothetical protein